MKPRSNELGNKNIIGHKVTRMRKLNRMSQKELAFSMQLLGVDINLSSLSKLEGQTRAALDKEVYAIAKIFNISVDELFKGISFEGNQYLIYDSIFYKKTVTNNANSTDSIKMRILDKKGNIVLNDLIIDAGTTINLKELENNKYYTVEIWADNGWYMLNFR